MIKVNEGLDRFYTFIMENPVTAKNIGADAALVYIKRMEAKLKKIYNIGQVNRKFK